MSKRVALYLRVSTGEQTTENQRRELEGVVRHAGWEIVGVYEDHGISGAKGRDQRPEFDRLCQDATARKFDLIAAWAVDRLGRSLADLVGFLSELHALGVDLYLHQQRLDTTTPAGKAMFQMMGVFAEFERGMIRERVKAGLARAAANGRKGGRPRLSVTIEAEIRSRLSQGTGIRKIATELGIGVSVVQRIKNAATSLTEQAVRPDGET